MKNSVSGSDVEAVLNRSQFFARWKEWANIHPSVVSSEGANLFDFVIGVGAGSLPLVVDCMRSDSHCRGNGANMVIQSRCDARKSGGVNRWNVTITSQSGARCKIMPTFDEKGQCHGVMAQFSDLDLEPESTFLSPDHVGFQVPKGVVW